jgi:colanic acid biosynthesis glycosyl transferase WcaI
MSRRPLVVLCPHFAPDTAPTGDIITRIVAELAGTGRRIHVVTALPWYRAHAIEEGWGGRLVRRERTPWGSVTRVHPFPGKDKSNLARRALGFALFSLLAGVCTLTAGGWRRRPAAVLSMSPPLTLGLTGWLAARLRFTKCIFNIQDVFPDAAVETGAITNPGIIAVARWLERVSYRRSDSVVVLSEDLRANVAGKTGARHAAKVVVIPNFVDPAFVTPLPRDTALRREMGIGDEPVVMYAGNVGFSQSLELVIGAARRLPGAVFVINGDGSARPFRGDGEGPAEREVRWLPTEGTRARGARHSRHSCCAAAPGARGRQRALEDVRHPRGRPSRCRGDRRRDGGPAHHPGERGRHLRAAG